MGSNLPNGRASYGGLPIGPSIGVPVHTWKVWLESGQVLRVDIVVTSWTRYMKWRHTVDDSVQSDSFAMQESSFTFTPQDSTFSFEHRVGSYVGTMWFGF